MSIEKNIRDRIDDLINDGRRIAAEAGSAVAVETSNADELFGACSGWITSALNVIEIVCPHSLSAYRRQAAKLAVSTSVRRHLNYQQVYDLVALLERLLEDVDAGMLVTIQDQITAINYDNFLDHAEDYLKSNKKNEAAVIAAVVFEDTIRTVCRANNIEENGINLDRLISDLDKADIMSGLKAKRARAAGGLRTSATHARWNEFEISDVKPVIEFTRELLEKKLAS